MTRAAEWGGRRSEFVTARIRCRVGMASGRAGALVEGPFLLEAVAARRIPKLTFESATEGRFRLVSHFSRNFGNAARRILQRARTQVKPPASQIRHGRLGKVPGKTLDESSPGNAHLVRQIRDRPRMGNAAVQQSEAFADDGIARAGEPPGLLFRQPGHIAAQGVNEQSLR